MICMQIKAIMLSSAILSSSLSQQDITRDD
jgi:hypothetical protein